MDSVSNGSPASASVPPVSKKDVRTLEERVLDTGLELSITRGPSWTTLSEVARRSGVSRATIYRKWPNVQAIFIDVLAREYLTIVGRAIAEDQRVHAPLENTPGAATKLERLVDALQHIARSIRALPLLKALTDHDPAAIVNVLFVEANPVSTKLVEVLELIISLGGDDGTIRQDNMRQVASTVVLTITGFVMTGPIVYPDDETLQAALRDTLTRLLKTD